MSGLKRTLQTRTLEEKYFAIKVIEEGKKSKTQLAKDIGIPLNTLSTWLNPRNAKNIIDKYEKGVFTPKARRMRMSKSADVEAALLKWLSHVCANRIPLNGPAIQAKAIDLAAELGYSNFRCDHTWVMRFCRRHAIPYGRNGGDDPSACGEHVGEWCKTTLLPIPQECEAEGILSNDETGRFFKVLPGQALTLAGEVCDTGRKSKDGMTKMLPLFISGRSKASRSSCKKKLKMPSANVDTDQRIGFKKRTRKFRHQKWKLLKTIGNSADYPRARDVTNVEHAVLQANISSQIQPVDESILGALNIYYRKAILDMHLKAAEASEAATINVLQALECLAEVWQTTASKTGSDHSHLASSQGDEKSITKDNNECENVDDHEGNIPMSSVTSRVAAEEQCCEDDDVKAVIHSNGAAARVLQEECLSSVNEDTSETEDNNSLPASPKASISQKEALSCLDKVKLFLQNKTNTEEQLSKIISVQNDIKTMLS